MAQVQGTLKAVAVEKLRGVLRGALREAQAAVAEVAKAEAEARETAERRAHGDLANELGRLAKTEAVRVASAAKATMWSVRNRKLQKAEVPGQGNPRAISCGTCKANTRGDHEYMASIAHFHAGGSKEHKEPTKKIEKSSPIGTPGLARAMRLTLAAGKKPQAAAPTPSPAPGATPPPVKKDEMDPMAKAATPPRPHTKEGLALAGAAIPPPAPGAAPVKMPGITPAAGAGRPGGYKIPGLKPKAGPPPIPAAAAVPHADKQVRGMRSIAGTGSHMAAMGKGEDKAKLLSPKKVAKSEALCKGCSKSESLCKCMK